MTMCHDCDVGNSKALLALFVEAILVILVGPKMLVNYKLRRALISLDSIVHT